MRSVSANREVIVSAGAIGSPKVLMLSGVGPAYHLLFHKVSPKEEVTREVYTRRGWVTGVVYCFFHLSDYTIKIFTLYYPTDPRRP